MKTALKTTAIIAGSGLIAGLANAQTSPVVGFETLPNEQGFNFVSVRLHENPIASGQLESAPTTSSVKDDDIDLAALITSGTYILEIEDGSGIIQEITSGDGAGGLTTPSDLSGLTYPVDYSLRPASTLASAIGNTSAEVGLDKGSGSVANADEVWVPNKGAGGIGWDGTFTKYYFDNFAFDGMGFVESWVNVDTLALVDGATVNLIYADGFIISSAAGTDLTISGDLKAGPTELNLAGGFNIVGSVAPVGQTLGTAFGLTGAEVGLDKGSGSVANADEVWLPIPPPTGGFNKYYFDLFAFDGMGFVESWVNVDTLALEDGSQVVGPGYIISAATGGGDVTQGVPSYYTGL